MADTCKTARLSVVAVDRLQLVPLTRNQLVPVVDHKGSHAGMLAAPLCPPAVVARTPAAHALWLPMVVFTRFRNGWWVVIPVRQSTVFVVDFRVQPARLADGSKQVLLKRRELLVVRDWFIVELVVITHADMLVVPHCPVNTIASKPAQIALDVEWVQRPRIARTRGMARMSRL